jgi:hypothetical protein
MITNQPAPNAIGSRSRHRGALCRIVSGGHLVSNCFGGCWLCALPGSSTRQSGDRQARPEPARTRGAARKPAGAGALFKARMRHAALVRSAASRSGPTRCMIAVMLQEPRRPALRHRAATGQSASTAVLRPSGVCRPCQHGWPRSPHHSAFADHDDGHRSGREQPDLRRPAQTAKRPWTTRRIVTATYWSGPSSTRQARTGPIAVAQSSQ